MYSISNDEKSKQLKEHKIQGNSTNTYIKFVKSYSSNREDRDRYNPLCMHNEYAKSSVIQCFNNRQSKKSDMQNVIQCAKPTWLKDRRPGGQTNNLDGIPGELHDDIYDACDEMGQQHTQLARCKLDLYSEDLRSKETIADAGVDKTHQRYPEIRVNKCPFTERRGIFRGPHTAESFRQQLADDKKSGFSSVGSMKGAIKHELSHILELRLDFQKNKVNFGDEIFGAGSSSKSQAAKDWNNHVIAKDICIKAYNSSTVRKIDPHKVINVGSVKVIDLLSNIQNESGSNGWFASTRAKQSLGEYATQSFGECFAEALAEAEESSRPRQFACAVKVAYADYMHDKGYN